MVVKQKANITLCGKGGKESGHSKQGVGQAVVQFTRFVRVCVCVLLRKHTSPVVKAVFSCSVTISITASKFSLFTYVVL